MAHGVDVVYVTLAAAYGFGEFSLSGQSPISSVMTRTTLTCYTVQHKYYTIT